MEGILVITLSPIHMSHQVGLCFRTLGSFILMAARTLSFLATAFRATASTTASRLTTLATEIPPTSEEKCIKGNYMTAMPIS